jgi:hypothetical protein
MTSIWIQKREIHMPSQLLVAHLGHAASLFGLQSQENVSHLVATSDLKLMLLAVMTP